MIVMFPHFSKVFSIELKYLCNGSVHMPINHYFNTLIVQQDHFLTPKSLKFLVAPSYWSKFYIIEALRMF